MNGLLLTPEEIRVACLKAADAFDGCGVAEDESWELFRNRWLCRAQLRKVHDEWQKVEGHCQSASPCPDAGREQSWCYACQLREFMAALKAAGGEG